MHLHIIEEYDGKNRFRALPAFRAHERQQAGPRALPLYFPEMFFYPPHSPPDSYASRS